MKIPRYFALLAVTMSPLLTGFSQTAKPPAASTANASSNLSPGATEVAKLAQSGVSDDVVLAFIGQSQSYYYLSASDIASLKNAGVSSDAVTAMLNHDSGLRTQQQSLSPAAATAAAPSVTAAPTPVTIPTPANTTVVVQSAPPPPQVEVVPVSPGPDNLWTPGYWSWNGGAWIWIGGYWHYPSRRGHIWIGGHWAGHGRGRAWVGGHWR